MSEDLEEVRPRPAPKMPVSGEKFTALVQRKGFKDMAELAQRAGLAAATVYRCAAGETAPRRDTLEKLAKALAMTPGELFDACWSSTS